MATDGRRQYEATWYKDAVIYEVHVRAFADSDGDGIGDFAGLTGKLGYLRDLGVTAIWLLPFYPSPLRDDGYDIADYNDVHPAYGTMADLEQFLEEAHRRGLRVITELVVNHTSDQHPWFQRARRAPAGSVERDFYVWSETPERYADTRIIFKDFEASNWSWDPVARAYYWHRFYSHQPDLNFDAPAVHDAVLAALDFWLSRGVDGLRLDAVPYLYEREGTNCENLPETHAFLRKLRRHVDERFPGRMLLAEANQWPEDAIAYFGQGDECHMAFHFPAMPRLFMGTRMEDRFPIIDILQQTPPIPDTCQWALFLRNHDELTLEMVTDEERDYMYRAYAHEPQMRINLGIRRRLAPLLGNDRRRIELMNGLLFSLPGTPVLYYGDEIGMGDNVFLGDRNGVRTPMQWNADRNGGFSRASAQQLYLPMVMEGEYNFQSLNVEAQQNNPNSLLWWTRRLIALRRRYCAFSRGTIEFLPASNRKVLAFLRQYQDETLLVVANLSRYAQSTELDLSAFHGYRPVELFGRGRLPEIGEAPYQLTLGGHQFFWLELEAAREGAGEGEQPKVPELVVADGWERLLEQPTAEALEEILPGWLCRMRWFGGKARTILGVHVRQSMPLPAGENGPPVRLALIDVNYSEGEPETYLVPMMAAAAADAERIAAEAPHAAIAQVRIADDGEPVMLCDAASNRGFGAALLEFIAGGRRVKGSPADLVGTAFPALGQLLPEGEPLPEPSLARAEQSNTSIAFGQRFMLKLFRRVEAGVNPDLEIGRFLVERARFASTPATAGALELKPPREEPWTLAILQQYVENQGDAWRFTIDALGRYFERILTTQSALDLEASAPPRGPEIAAARSLDPGAGYDILGTYYESALLLGRRTGEMHLALASGDDAAFAPEPFSTLYQRSLYQSLRTLTINALGLLERTVERLQGATRARAEAALARRDAILDVFGRLLGGKIGAMRTRVHGDYHLGQVLYTGGDFVIIDFEGEPARTLGDRRIKRAPLRDVAGMLRSFAYAAEVGLRRAADQGMATEAALPRLQAAAEAWRGWTSLVYLRAYLEAAAGSLAVPSSEADTQLLLETFLLEKAVYELSYELNNRPDWVRIPLAGLERLLP